jgi:hypothetical protein
MELLLEKGAPIGRSEKIREILGDKDSLLMIALGVLLSQFDVDIALAYAIAPHIIP